jgi:glycerate kinase
VDKKREIETFNQTLETSLNDANFIIDGEGEFDSLYLQDIEDDYNSGV